MHRTSFTTADGCVLLAVFLLSVVLFCLPFLQTDPAEHLLVTTLQGSQSYRLQEDRELILESEQLTLKVVISSGRVCVLESDCPDGICRQSGWISRSGQSIVCAPAGVRLLIQGGGEGDQDVDFVAG